MNLNLFKLALDRLESSDWGEFEALSSAFLVSEFSDLRTMANPSGDGGRDSELFTTDSSPFIAFQYSIQKDWKKKIAKTAARLAEEFPDVKYLIYLSNQLIGANADELKRTLREKGLFVDVRDRNWFIERADTKDVRQNAAERLIDKVARPYLAGEQVINKPSSALTSQEARAALLYLGLQWQDDVTGKGLTKLSLDALVRAALRHTHGDNRMPRREIFEKIEAYLPSVDKDSLETYVNAALKRLTKKYIRHWQKDDEFCLTHEERQKMLVKIAETENEEEEFYTEVMEQCSKCLQHVTGANENDLEDLKARIPRVIENFLLARGEAFVSAINNDNLLRFGFDQLNDVILKDITWKPPSKGMIQHILPVVSTSVRILLTEPKESTQHYLTRLANSYTLFSFLRETPDVRTATNKLFSHGTVWLDTTVLLPVLAEQLHDDESLRRLTSLLLLCVEAGIELRVTPGNVGEIVSHMNKAYACSQYTSGSWRGRVPYLYQRYFQTGRRPEEFPKWLSFFRGMQRPEDDVAQYLADVFGVQRVSLSEEAAKVDEKLRWAADRLWSEAHRQRRQGADEEGDLTIKQLIEHDLETYLGVVALRQQEQVTELGYRYWLLTFDRIAWQIRNSLREEFARKTPPSPLLSLDYLVNSLTFGPERHRIPKLQEHRLPIIYDIEMVESMPEDILRMADEIRRDNEGLPEYVIRRKVRDAIDRAKTHRACSTIDNHSE